MQYQKMIKTTAPKILIILSSLNITVACADANFVPHTATSIKTESSNFTEEVKNMVVCQKVCWLKLEQFLKP